LDGIYHDLFFAFSPSFLLKRLHFKKTTSFVKKDAGKNVICEPGPSSQMVVEN